MTSLGASDVFLREVSDRILHVPIHLPLGIKTLDFDLTPLQISALYDTGYAQTVEALREYKPLQDSRALAEQLQDTLVAQFGDVKLYENVLRAIAHDIESLSTARDVRVNIMLCTGRKMPNGHRSRMVVYSHGMDHAPDRDLEIAEGAGCSGNAWLKQEPSVADLLEAAKNPEIWGMTAREHERVPANRASMLSVHIPERSGGEITHPVGTLSVDSATPLADTSWVVNGHMNQVVTKNLILWSHVIARLLP